MESNARLGAPLKLLEKDSNLNLLSSSRLSVQTPYGLILTTAEDGSIDIRLSDSSAPNPTDQSSKNYRYHISLDWHTTFLWYDVDWPGNPEGKNHVDPEVIEERYSKDWCDAYLKWVEKYDKSFERGECHLGSGGKLFTDPVERAAWALEGLLLGCWLALQPGVSEVELILHEKTGRVLKREGLGTGARRFIEHLVSTGCPELS